MDSRVHNTVAYTMMNQEEHVVGQASRPVAFDWRNVLFIEQVKVFMWPDHPMGTGTRVTLLNGEHLTIETSFSTALEAWSEAVS